MRLIVFLKRVRPLFFAGLVVAVALSGGLPAQAQERPRNVILFISDGCGPVSFTMARDFARTIQGRASLALDAHQVGSLRTYASDSRVTDSAAGATAYACGVKTYNGAIAVDTLQRPVSTLLEGAEAKGMATGLVATSRGLFSDSHMDFDIDRDPATQPSLAEMTHTAIDLLKDDPDGFFLMVEGSRIDHAGHGNDPAAHLHEVLAYDEAVAAALAYAEEDGATLVVSTSDHETGGMTLGRVIDGEGIYAWYPEVLARVSRSQLAMVEVFVRARQPIADVMRSMAGIDDLTYQEEALTAAMQHEMAGGSR